MNPPSNDRLEGGFCNGVFDCLPVKARIYRVEVLRVHAVLSKTESVGEPLIMNDLALAEIFYGVANVGIIHKSQDIIVGHARFLLCYYHVFATTLSVALRRHLSQRARLLYV